MSKANRRFRSDPQGYTVPVHSAAGEYKIPIEDRKAFMGSNKHKWVSKKKYDDYLQWKKRQ